MVFSALAKAGASYIHTTEHYAHVPAFGEGLSLSALAVRYSGLAVIANGSLHQPMRAQAMIASGQAHFIALGRGALAASDWPERLRRNQLLPDFHESILMPLADLESAVNFQQV